MKIKILTGMCAFFLSGVAFAECPSDQNTEKMIECITVEGSGANYQDWQKNEYEFNLETTSKTASEDTEANTSKK
jgi:hypothetical protein